MWLALAMPSSSCTFGNSRYCLYIINKLAGGLLLYSQWLASLFEYSSSDCYPCCQHGASVEMNSKLSLIQLEMAYLQLVCLNEQLLVLVLYQCQLYEAPTFV